LASATAAPSPNPELQPVINVTDIAQSSFVDLRGETPNARAERRAGDAPLDGTTVKELPLQTKPADGASAPTQG
jgi:hypothetical protein